MEDEKEEKIKSLAGEIHEGWRSRRRKEESNDYGQRIKKTKDKNWSESHAGAEDVDIANTSYEDLPNDWQEENRASAEVSLDEVEKAIAYGKPLDESFVEVASSVLHNKRLKRNGIWVPLREQNMPYDELSEEEKEKDRAIIRLAIKVCTNEE